MKITVKIPFELTNDNGDVIRFGVGDHEVSDAVANHWFVLLHLAPVDDVEPEPVYVPKVEIKKEVVIAPVITPVIAPVAAQVVAPVAPKRGRPRK